MLAIGVCGSNTKNGIQKYWRHSLNQHSFQELSAPFKIECWFKYNKTFLKKEYFKESVMSV